MCFEQKSVLKYHVYQQLLCKILFVFERFFFLYNVISNQARVDSPQKMNFFLLTCPPHDEAISEFYWCIPAARRRTQQEHQQSLKNMLVSNQDVFFLNNIQIKKMTNNPIPAADDGLLFWFVWLSTIFSIGRTSLMSVPLHDVLYCVPLGHENCCPIPFWTQSRTVPSGLGTKPAQITCCPSLLVMRRSKSLFVDPRVIELDWLLKRRRIDQIKSN